MKTMTKRLLVLLLAAIMVLSVLAACQNGGTPSDGTAAVPVTNGNNPGGETGAETAQSGPNIPVFDMDGFSINFLNYAEGSGYSKATLDVEYSEGIDIVDEAIYRRNRNIEDTYTCEISVYGVTAPHTTLNTAVGSGDDSFDVAMVYEEFISQVLENVRSWKDMPYVDLTADWWNKNANTVFNIRGIQFAATGDFSLSQYNKIYAFVYNKELYENFNVGYDLYEGVRNHTWTMDRLYEIAKPFNRNLDGDANTVSDEDGHGIVATSKVLFSMLLTGAGARIIENDYNDEPAFALTKPEYLNILEKMVEINLVDGYYRNVPESNGGLRWDEYNSGNTLFYAAIFSAIDGTRSLPFSTGYMPAPLLNEEQEDYHTIAIGCNVAVLPKSLPTERMNNVGILLEALSYLSRSTVVTTYRDTYLKTKLANEDDAEMIQLMFDTVDYDLGNNLFARKGRLDINDRIFHTLERNFTSTLEVLGTDLENQISDVLEKLEEIDD